MTFVVVIFIFHLLLPVFGQLNFNNTNDEKCSLNCYEPKNHTRISCENGFSSYRLKRSNRIILEHPVGKQNLPKSVEHLRCLKTFSCQRPTDKPPATSTLTPFPPDEIGNHIQEIDSIYEQIKNESQSITPDKLEEFLSDLTEIIKNITISNVNMANLTYSSLLVVDNLLGRSETWLNMTNVQRLKSSDKVLNLAENLALLMNKKQEEEPFDDRPIVVIECSNVLLHSKYSTLQSNQSLMYELNNTRLSLPSMSLSSNSTDKISISSTASLVNSKNLISQICGNDTMNEFQLLNTPIVSMVINDDNKTVHFPEPHYFNLETTNYDRLIFGDKPTCYYWNITEKCWSTEGCYYRKIQSNRSASICECNHLTSIVIIVDIYGRDGDDQIKTWLTRITSTITILCTMIALFISFRYNRETLNVLNDQFRTKSNLFLLNFHMGIWLVVSHLIILFGLEREKDEPNLLCQSISIILLFSLLAMICFTFLKCFHCSWFIVFSPLGVAISSRNYLLIGYISPMAIIGIGLTWFYWTETQVWQDVLESLCGRYFCWLSSYRYTKHIWLFLGPLYGLFTTNLILFVLIMYRYCTSPIHTRSSKTKHLFSVMLNAFLFFCNFGLTWLLAIIYINEQIPIPYLFSILFIILNGSQGIFLLTEQVFRFFKRKNRIKQTKTMSTKMRTSISVNSSNISYGSGSGSFNEVQKSSYNKINGDSILSSSQQQEIQPSYRRTEMLEKENHLNENDEHDHNNNNINKQNHHNH